MPKFVASRWSGNDNSVFPDIIEIDPINVTYFKGTVVGYRKMVIPRAQISSVYIASGLLFADVIVATTGNDEIRARGFYKKDARVVVQMLT